MQSCCATNQELWRQAEERKRLNAAFAHDLRNPITVLKGSVRLLRQDPADQQALDRLESYTIRIEQYVEAMSSIQRLEQMPLRTAGAALDNLWAELEAGGQVIKISGTNYVKDGSDSEPKSSGATGVTDAIQELKETVKAAIIKGQTDVDLIDLRNFKDIVNAAVSEESGADENWSW